MTESEQKTAREMVAAIWGLDLDTVQQVEVSTTEDQILISSAYFRVLKSGALEEVPASFVHLDRWIVPWKVKAGYSARINMLAFRVEGE